jgi:hypothetical protein
VLSLRLPCHSESDQKIHAFVSQTKNAVNALPNNGSLIIPGGLLDYVPKRKKGCLHF